MKRRFTLYCHTNKVNGKKYVGQTVDTVEGRWKEHLSAAKQHRGARIFGHAIRKYGAEVFDHEVLEVVDTQIEADLAEAKWITRLRSRSPDGYNLALGGSGPGYHHDVSKRLISESSRKRLHDMDPKQRAAYFQKNIHRWTPERRARALELQKSEEFRRAVATGQKKFWSKFTPEEKTRRVQHQQAGMSFSQKSERVRKAWTGMSPEARKARVAKAASSAIAAKSSPAHSKKMSEWQTAQAKLRTPEQRRAMVLKAWAVRRAKYGKRGHAKASETFSEATRKGWTNMTPEARTNRVRKIQEGRRKTKEARHIELASRMVRINLLRAA